MSASYVSEYGTNLKFEFHCRWLFVLQKKTCLVDYVDYLGAKNVKILETFLSCWSEENL